jgi:two-component system, NtrC family, response regulator HydG
MSDDDSIKPSDFSFALPESREENRKNINLEEIERSAIVKAINKHSGNISHAAGELGLTRAALYRRIKKYGL